MSQVRPTEKIHFDETAFQEREALSPQEAKDQTTGLALHQVFNQDILNELISRSVEMETLTPSLWQRILAWFKGADKDLVSQASSKKAVEKPNEIKTEAIDSVPVLDLPDTHLEDIIGAKLPPISKKGNLKAELTTSEFEEALSLMSEQTIETIMFIIFKMQVQLEKENAQTAESTFSKYLDFQKLQQQVLVEIKDALVNDENIAKRFGTAQNIASYFAGIAAIATVFGLVGPVLGFLSTAAAAGLTGLTTGGKAYFQRLMNEHRAQHEEYTHHDQYYNGRVDDSRNRLMATAEADTVFKERWIQFLRRSDKMRKLVFKK